MQKSAKLRDFLLSVYQTSSDRYLDFWERHLSQHDGVLVIGTDPSEWWVGYETTLDAIRPQIKAMAGLVLEGNPQAWVEGTVGWFADEQKWKWPNGAVTPVRWTGVCCLDDGEWKIVQSHVSRGVPDR